jgi:hypothetical protein
MGAGMLLNAYAQYQEGEAAMEQAKRNAKLLGIQRGLVLRAGEAEASRIEAEGRSVMGSATAATVGNMVDPTVGSSSQLIGQSGMSAAADAVRTRAAAVSEAWGLGQQAQNELATGRARRRMGRLGALGTLGSGAGYMYGEYGGTSQPSLQSTSPNRGLKVT